MKFDLGIKKEMNREILKKINEAPTIPWDGSCWEDGWPKFQKSGQEDVYHQLFIRVWKGIPLKDDKWVVEDGKWDYWKEDYTTGATKKPQSDYEKQRKEACEWVLDFMERYERLGVRG